MNKLSIIIPYSSDRIDHFNILMDRLNKLDKNCFEIVPELSDEKPFNTGRVQNRAIEKASNDWILKNDVDCVADETLYYYALGSIQGRNYHGYSIFGVEYLKQDGTINERFPKCGNEYLFNKILWQRVSKIPEWTGYFAEDYAFEYKMHRYTWNKGDEANCDIDNTHHWIRDNITIPANSENPFYFQHMWHEKKVDIESIKRNKKKLYELVRNYE